MALKKDPLEEGGKMSPFFLLIIIGKNYRTLGGVAIPHEYWVFCKKNTLSIDNREASGKIQLLRQNHTGLRGRKRKEFLYAEV